MTSPLTPLSLQLVRDDLAIVWSDDRNDRIPVRDLRKHCPCATCKVARDEAAAKPSAATLLPVLSAAEARPLKLTGMQPVGNYAYAVQFSDGHNSGIYTFEHLRRLGEQQRHG